uniref:Histone-lysine N-methyltransferase SETMAR n=1 Tax=Glossina palpalis gambiensis TaxID=67801 RepID=A0A1B0C599_9MUSC
MVRVWLSRTGVDYYDFMKPSNIAEIHRDRIAHCTNDRAPKLQDLELELLYHSRYEPDLAPTDYHFFRNLDNFLIVKNFSSDNALKLASHEFIDSRPSGFYTTGLNNLPLKWQRTI